jgi:hypothetical protein
MKDALSETKLRSVWVTLTLQVGKLSNVDMNVETKKNGDYNTLVIPCTFDRGKLNLWIALNSDGKISGLVFRP